MLANAPSVSPSAFVGSLQGRECGPAVLLAVVAHPVMVGMV
jgi:hypothetical protein